MLKTFDNESIITAVENISNHRYQHFEESVNVLLEDVANNPQDFTKLSLLSFGLWVLQNYEKASTYGKLALALNTKVPYLYNTLIWNALTSGNFVDAYLFSQTAMVECPEFKANFLPYVKLSTAMMQGIKCVDFVCNNIFYKFVISCFNGQAMETSLHHLHGGFVEFEELSFVQNFVGSAKVIVEIGILMGNHTVFFLKNLSPSEIICIDADSRSIEYTRKNFDLNVEGSKTRLLTIHSGIGDIRCEANIAGNFVAVNTLDQLITVPFDFIKIDVDGWELKFLRGAKESLARYHPKIMIEVKKDFDKDFLILIQELHYIVVHKIVRGVDSNYFLIHQLDDINHAH